MMNKNTELRRAAIDLFERPANYLIREKDLSNSDSRYCIVSVNGEDYRIYMVGTSECIDDDEFYQYGITDDNHILKFYFDWPNDMDADELDYSRAYRVVDVTEDWKYTTELGAYLEGDEDEEDS